MTNPDCLFCKIVAGDIPADIVFENDTVTAFRDISPKAPVHVLIIPKKHIATVDEIADSDARTVGTLLTAARDIARDSGLSDDGYRLVMNCKEAAGQTVFHIHLHLLGGRELDWPPG